MRNIILLFALAVTTTSCQLPAIDVTVCNQNGLVAFALADIEDVFSTNAPRPDHIWVGKDKGEGAEGTRLEAVWTVSLPNAPDNRPEMKVVTYGQEIAGWETEVPATPLEQGVQYDVLIDDGGHSGGVMFRYGDPLPACEPN